jgi:tetratricopeptide (TPR) repeat protein
MRNNKVAIYLAASSLMLGVVLAAGIADVKALYAKGSFKEASDMAATLKTAEGFVWAAKSLSIYAQTRPVSEQDDHYAKAEGYATKAIDLDANNADGYFELARADGRLSQLRGVLASLAQGYGSKIKENLDKAIKLNPKHASAMVALGLWHAEIVNKGVAWLYGADGRQISPLMEAAIKLEPDQVIHRVEYARALVLLDRAKYKERAIDLLEGALKLKPSDAAEQLDYARAQRDLAELKK